MDTYKVNYHMHSYYSDGVLSPGELVRKFHDEDYDSIALTDHDGIMGVKEFLAACDAVKIQGITGIEFSTEHEFGGKKYEIHLLGFKFDPDNEELIKKCDELKNNRHERNVKLFAKLNEMGYKLDIDQVESVSKGKYIGKPDIARALVKNGYIESVKEAFTPAIFDSPEIKCIHKKKPTTEESIRLILNAGGIPCVAHPAKIKNLPKRETQEFKDECELLIKDLKKKGLKGLECIYPEHSLDEEYFFIQLAGKYHLHVTQGTDFHSDDFK